MQITAKTPEIFNTSTPAEPRIELKGFEPPPALRERARTGSATAQSQAREAGGGRDGFELGRRSPADLAGGTQGGAAIALSALPPASTLQTEDIRDGQANCLDRVGDWLEMATPQIRGHAEVLILRDTRPGAEGQTGHAVIRQGSGIIDPSTRRSYASFEQFNADGRYSIAGTVGGSTLHRILSTPAGSAERQAALDRAGVSRALATMQVADTAQTVQTGRAWTLLTEGYRKSTTLEGAVQSALQAAAKDPALQSELVALLQGTSGESLDLRLQEGLYYEQHDASVPEHLRTRRPPADITSVGAERVGGSALEKVARQVPADLLLPALDAAAKDGRLSAADRDVYARCLGPTGKVDGARMAEAVAQVQKAEQAYTQAMQDCDALDRQLGLDLTSFGPYLTDTQRMQYIQQYRELHADEYSRARTAATALGDTLASNAELLDQALRGPEGMEHAKTIHAAYTALATSPHAAAALTWAVKAEAPGSAFAPYASTLDLTAITQNAVAGTIASYLEANPKAPPADAVTHLEKLLTSTHLYWAQQTGGAVADLSASNLPQAVRAGVQGLRQIANGQMRQGLEALGELQAGSSKWAGPFAAAGFMIGLMQKNEALASNDGLSATWARVFSAQQAAGGVSSLFSLVKWSAGANVAGRLAGGLGVGASVLDLAVQGREVWRGEGNAGTLVSVVGDLASIAGGYLIATGATGVGAPLAAVGALLYVAGEYASSSILEREAAEQRQAQIRQDQRSILEKMGLDPDGMMTLAQKMTPQQVEVLMGRTEWTGDQLSQLSKTFPALFSNRQYLVQLEQVGQAFQLTPNQRFELLNAIIQTSSPAEPGKLQALERFANAVSQFPNPTGFQMPAGLDAPQQWIHYLGHFGTARGVYDGEALRNAASYLSSLRPD